MRGGTGGVKPTEAFDRANALGTGTDKVRSMGKCNGELKKDKAVPYF